MKDNGVEQLEKEGKNSPRGYFGWLKKARSIGLQLVVLMIIVWVVDLWLTRNTVHATPPLISQRTIAGEEFSTDMLKGQSSLIHFWGTWCPVCNIEQGTIESMGRDYPMVTVAMQSGGDDEIAAYLAAKGVSYRVVNDHSGIISNSYGVKAVPTTFILDRDGEIKFVTQGYSSELGLRFKLWLSAL